MSVKPETATFESGPETFIRPQLDYALQAAELGYRVFPCRAGAKVPLITDWEAKATTDPMIIHSWWKRWSDANIGAAVGASAATVLDVDVKDGKQGTESLWDLEDLYGSIPRSRVAKTPTGGLHIHMAGVTRSRNGVLGNGLDVKSSGGYVLMPGSWIDGKPYTWAKRGSLEPAPAWFLNRAGEPSASANDGETREDSCSDHESDVAWATHYLAHDAPVAIERRGGDTTTFQVACSLRDRGLSAAVTYALMLELYNPRCIPPWPTSDGTNTCLKAKVDNAFKYAAGTAGAKSAAADFAEAPNAEGGPERRSRFKELTRSELRDVTAPRWLVDRLIPENGLAVVYGQPKSCKTFWALDLSLSVATGGEFHGLSVRKGRTTYIAAEGGVARLGDRVRAWMSIHNTENAADSWGLIAQRVDLMNLPEVTDLVHAIGGKRDLIVIDTLARCMSGDENSQKDMSAFIAGCDRLREATGAAVLIVHHEGKDAAKGARGSNTLRGAIDSGVRVRREGNGGSVVVTVEDQRDGEPLTPMRFELRNVPIAGIEDASAALFAIAESGEKADEAIFETAVGLIGSSKKVLDTAVAKMLNISPATAVRRTHSAIKQGRSLAVAHRGTLLWFERADDKNKQSALILRGAAISEANTKDVEDY